MKITDRLNNGKYSLSFEVFPPKTDTIFEVVKNATFEIAKLLPSYMSVTYGAGGGTSKFTLDIAKSIQEKYAVPTLAHLTCVSSTKDDVKEKIELMKKLGIENVLALRGDLTEELIKSGRDNCDYKYAVDLIKDIKDSKADFCIGGACYPEVHPESKNRVEDIKHLKEKVDAGCEFLTTQMVFDNDLLYNFIYKIREAGIEVPIVVGIMPITTKNTVKRALELSHSFLPKKFITLVDKFGDDESAIKQAGIIYATEQIVDLYANGIQNVHVYSMNKPDVARKIQENLSDILGK